MIHEADLHDKIRRGKPNLWRINTLLHANKNYSNKAVADNNLKMVELDSTMQFFSLQKQYVYNQSLGLILLDPAIIQSSMLGKICRKRFSASVLAPLNCSWCCIGIQKIMFL